MVDKKIMPLFNYIGGKTWLKEHLKKEVSKILFEKKITHYAEPFAGGLGAFLGVYDTLIEKGVKNIILNDINGKLINFYQMVQNNSHELIESYIALENDYALTISEEAKLLHKTKDKLLLKKELLNSEKYYKKVRDSFNKEQKNIDSAVALLFLQNHCFNGIYRENSKGGYNTPFNWDCKIFTHEKISEKIMAVHELFKKFNIEFSNKSFEDLDFNDYTLYYLDPPYVNEIEALENQYNKDSFNIDKQKSLIKAIETTSFIYSNHDNEFLIKEFSNNNMNIEIKRISRKNIISASNESRKQDKVEILVSTKFIEKTIIEKEFFNSNLCTNEIINNYIVPDCLYGLNDKKKQYKLEKKHNDLINKETMTAEQLFNISMNRFPQLYTSETLEKAKLRFYYSIFNFDNNIKNKSQIEQLRMSQKFNEKYLFLSESFPEKYLTKEDLYICYTQIDKKGKPKENSILSELYTLSELRNKPQIKYFILGYCVNNQENTIPHENFDKKTSFAWQDLSKIDKSWLEAGIIFYNDLKRFFKSEERYIYFLNNQNKFINKLEYEKNLLKEDLQTDKNINSDVDRSINVLEIDQLKNKYENLSIYIDDIENLGLDLEKEINTILNFLDLTIDRLNFFIHRNNNS